MADTPQAISLTDAFAALDFLPNRTPSAEEAPDDGGPNWVGTLADYRDGGVYIVHYAGTSEWERHRHGDEVVMCVDGSTTITLLLDDGPAEIDLTAQQMIIVPQGVWHRFVTPSGAKIMTITPQPTDHSVEHPNGR